MSTYVATIGLEVHVELATKSKMFCGCRNNPHEAEANTHTCPVCLAHPGTLPVPNEEAVAKVLLFGQAVNSTPADFSEFDRKNYFYPDIPKAYQISQYAFPFLTGGSLNGVTLTRVHLEEDTARSQHDKGDESLIDFNRAGVPLMELVTEPVIHSAHEAGSFARELQLLLRTLSISRAQMERGEMRVEANISVSKNDALGTKVEVKNLNSFRSVEGAITYEIERQTVILEAGDRVRQETRGWDEIKMSTFLQRVKETAKDYRYFPDPDIPKIRVSTYTKYSRLSENMPLLPEKKRERYKDIGIPSMQIEAIIGDDFTDNYFGAIVKESSQNQNGNQKVILKAAANYLASDLVGILASNNDGRTFLLRPTHFLELVTLVNESKITSRVAKDLLKEIAFTDENPTELAMERNLMQSEDTDLLSNIVAEVIAENPMVVNDYKSGKSSSLQYLIGQAMKKTRGTANPRRISDLLESELS